MRSSKLRLKPLEWLLASGFFIWCVVVYIAKNGEMQVIMLADPLMWPLDIFLFPTYSAIGGWLAPGDPREVSSSTWLQIDLIFDVVLVFSGTLWHWLVGRLIFILATAIFHGPLFRKIRQL